MGRSMPEVASAVMYCATSARGGVSMSPWPREGHSRNGTPFSSISRGMAKRVKTSEMVSMMAPSA